MGDLIVPLALWNTGATSLQSVTALVVTPSKRHIVTGTSSGRIYLWQLSTSDSAAKSPKPFKLRSSGSVLVKEQSIQNETSATDDSEKQEKQQKSESKEERLALCCIMLGHKQPVTAIASATFDGEEAVISASADGTVCVWSVSDGHCLYAAEKLLKCLPTSMTVLPKGTHVAFAGHRTFIEIVHLKTLTVTSTLAAHQHWITCLYSCDLSRSSQASSPLLVSAGADGVVQFWSLREGEGESPLQTLCLEIDEPLSLSLSPNNKLLLIVTAEEWILYTSKASKEIMAVPCPDIGGWKGGSFIGNSAVIVWSNEGNGYVYGIPNAPTAVPLSFTSSQNNSSNSLSSPAIADGLRTSFEKTEEEIVVEAPTKSVSNFRSSLLSKLKIVDKNTETQPNFICSHKVKEGEDGLASVFINYVGASGGSVFATGDEQGRLAVWIIPSKTDKIQTASRIMPYALTGDSSSSVSHRRSFTPSLSTSSSSLPGLPHSSPITTTTINSQESGTTVAQAETAAEQPLVTASIVVEESLLLVLGYNNGCITVATLPTADTSKLRYQLAHRGSVTALLSIAMAKDVRVVSGGEDFEINVWSIKDKSSFNLLYKFHNHFGPIVSLFRPQITKSTGEASRWKDYFFSISKDKTIGLFSIPNNNCQHVYGVHPSFIVNVKWQMEQDYLFVECDDGSVSVWEMGTGRLEATVYGEVGRDMLRCSSNLLPETNGESIELHQKSIHAFTISSLQDPSPIQLIFLNVRKLLNDLERSMKQSRRASNAVTPPQGLTSSGSMTNINDRTPSSSSAPLSRSGSSLSVSGNNSAIFDNGQPTLVPPPVNSAAYSVFSWFIPWDRNPQLDAQCKEELQLQPPSPDIAFAIRGYAGKMTILVPQVYPTGCDRWIRSDRLSALHTLSAVTYTKNLMNVEPYKNVCSQLLTYYCTIIPDTLPHYVNPSLPFLARYWRDPYDDVMQAARSIFASAASVMKPEDRQKLAKATSLKIRDEGEARYVAVIVLGVLGSLHADALDKETMNLITFELLKLLNNEEKESIALRIAAAELIGRGFTIWRPFIRDVDALIQQLFGMTLLADPPYISAVSHQAMMMIGVSEPKQFITSLGQYILEAHYSDNASGRALNASQHSAAILSLGNLLKQDPVALLPLLPRVVETIVRSLDPHVPYLRDTCLSATTSVLHTLVKKYPMVSFHQESQRLAVGTKEGVIVIYDLKTATKWHVLEEGKSPVTAISFANNGKMLVSYSISEAMVRFWSTTSSFLGILGSTPHCAKRVPVNKVDRNLSDINLLESVQLKWQSDKAVSLVRTWEGSLTIKL